MSKPRLSVIGTGYLGATHAVCMAELGYDVIGLDVDPDKVARLAGGEVPVGSSRVDLQACKLEYSIVSPK